MHKDSAGRKSQNRAGTSHMWCVCAPRTCLAPRGQQPSGWRDQAVSSARISPWIARAGRESCEGEAKSPCWGGGPTRCQACPCHSLPKAASAGAGAVWRREKRRRSWKKVKVHKMLILVGTRVLQAQGWQGSSASLPGCPEHTSPGTSSPALPSPPA